MNLKGLLRASDNGKNYKILLRAFLEVLNRPETDKGLLEELNIRIKSFSGPIEAIRESVGWRAATSCGTISAGANHLSLSLCS